MRRAVSCLATAVALSGALALPVLANGRSTPRPAGTAILTATCESRADGARLDIVRPRLAGLAVPEGALLIRADGAFAPIYLDLIRRIEIDDGMVADDDGAVAVQLQRADAEPATGSPARAKLQGDDKKPIRLRGFARDGTRVEIELAQCRRIDFAIVGDGPVDRPPLGAKAD